MLIFQGKGFKSKRIGEQAVFGGIYKTVVVMPHDFTANTFAHHENIYTTKLEDAEAILSSLNRDVYAFGKFETVVFYMNDQKDNIEKYLKIEYDFLKNKNVMLSIQDGSIEGGVLVYEKKYHKVEGEVWYT